ncbi:MAG: major capsid protein [Wigfec virus K19_174]|nr:MAG: major capsid protein [Wigfec virus K19_174]
MQPSMQRAPNTTISVQEMFSRLDNPVVPRSTFDRSFPVLTTLDAGYLVPLYWDEITPSDSVQLGLNMFGRINTLIKPIYDNLYLDIHAFFVPNRLVCSSWTQIMGEQPDPLNPVTKTVPQISWASTGGFTGVTSQSLANYLGMPVGYSSPSKTWSSLPFRAYKKIYDDLYRDENFVPLTLPISAIGDATVAYNDTTFPLYKRFKRKDYFTSATPGAQKGTAPTLSLGGNANVLPSGTVPLFSSVDGKVNAKPLSYYSSAVTGSANVLSDLTTPAVINSNLVWTSTTGLYADLTTATGFSLNAFREFATMQQYLERDMRSGNRYTESLYSRFGVTPEDSRLQRAEYLFGKTFDLMVTPIAQTSESASGTPQANLSGMGTFSAKQTLGTKSFSEHGIFMIIASVRQEQRYQQGIARKFSRESQFDFYDPLFANLGEQAILNHELLATGAATDLNAWGYQQAWADMRYNPAVITGKMSSEDPQSLDSWHLAQDHASLPALGKTFLEENVPMDRVVAVTDEPDFTLQGIIEMMHTRPLPQRSIPGLLKL